MVVRVAVNGFGRIGRCLFRFLWEMPDVGEREREIKSIKTQRSSWLWVVTRARERQREESSQAPRAPRLCYAQLKLFTGTQMRAIWYTQHVVLVLCCLSYSVHLYTHVVVVVVAVCLVHYYAVLCVLKQQQFSVQCPSRPRALLCVHYCCCCTTTSVLFTALVLLFALVLVWWFCASFFPSEIVLVNEIVGGAETAGYLLKYDSIHGSWWAYHNTTGSGVCTYHMIWYHGPILSNTAVLGSISVS